MKLKGGRASPGLHHGRKGVRTRKKDGGSFWEKWRTASFKSGVFLLFCSCVFVKWKSERTLNVQMVTWNRRRKRESEKEGEKERGREKGEGEREKGERERKGEREKEKRGE